LIQGHPNAANWQNKVNATLTMMEWNQTRHEPCLYRQEVKDAPDQLVCRQVDDMLLAVKTGEEYHKFNRMISKTINMDL